MEGGEEGVVRIRVTTGSTWSRGASALPFTLAIEILAQAAVFTLPDGGQEEGGGLLAGVNEAQFEAPLLPGDSLEARVELEGRFGRLVKARGQLTREGSGDPVASASLLLAMG